MPFVWLAVIDPYREAACGLKIDGLFKDYASLLAASGMYCFGAFVYAGLYCDLFDWLVGFASLRKGSFTPFGV